MRGWWFRAFSLIWLAVVTPLLGVLPLLVLLADPDSLTNRWGVAVLRDLRKLIMSDLAQGTSHITLYDLAPGPVWFVTIPAVFATAIFSLWYITSQRSNGQQTP